MIFVVIFVRVIFFIISTRAFPTIFNCLLSAGLSIAFRVIDTLIWRNNRTFCKDNKEVVLALATIRGKEVHSV